MSSEVRLPGSGVKYLVERMATDLKDPAKQCASPSIAENTIGSEEDAA